MTIAYFDLFSGISGDMTLGALVDLGVPMEEMLKQLAKLDVSGYRVTVQDVVTGGIRAKRVSVDVSPSASRSYHQIRGMLESADLPEGVKSRAVRIFHRLARAESKVHGVPVDDVHFHELGAVDSIVDIVGTAVGLDYLDIDEIYFSAVPLMQGEVHTAHGVFPLPAPATADLLVGFPVRFLRLEKELVTPTGAAILAALGGPVETLANMVIHRIGHGAGRHDLSDRPNLLRIFLGAALSPADRKDLVVLETNIDDMNPEIYEHLMDRLFETGALDVWLTPIIMKKSRPGTLVCALCERENQERISELIFEESTTLGIRWFPVSRVTLPRRLEKVETPLGIVSVKVAGKGESVVPEYEDCKRVAKDRGVPLKRVYELAILCYKRQK